MILMQYLHPVDIQNQFHSDVILVLCNNQNMYIYTANMCSEITVEVHLKNCNFEKLQFFTVDQCSLYFLQLKNCNFNIFTVFKNTTKKM